MCETNSRFVPIKTVVHFKCASLFSAEGEYAKPCWKKGWFVKLIQNILQQRNDRHILKDKSPRLSNKSTNILLKNILLSVKCTISSWLWLVRCMQQKNMVCQDITSYNHCIKSRKWPLVTKCKLCGLRVTPEGGVVLSIHVHVECVI